MFAITHFSTLAQCFPQFAETARSPVEKYFLGITVFIGLLRPIGCGSQGLPKFKTKRRAI
jgi:hypothetical protein